MTRFFLEIDLENEAMQSPEDVAEVLRLVGRAANLDGVKNAPIRDRNGNVVGKYGFKEV